MDWLVWSAVICAAVGAGLFAFGMRHDPLLALGVPCGMAGLTVLMVFLILWKTPSSKTAPEVPPAESNSDQIAQSPNNRPPVAKTEDPPVSEPERRPVPQPFTPVVPPPINRPGTDVVDLLALIEPKKHQLAGQWRMQDGALISPATFDFKPAKLSIPYRPPAKFQLTAEVKRLQGNDSFNVGLPIGGRDASVVLDGYNGVYSGINLLDGRTADRNESRRRGPFLSAVGTDTIVYTVGTNSVRVAVNGQIVLEWVGNVQRLSQDSRWANGPPGTIELGCWQTSYRITKLELKPLP